MILSVHVVAGGVAAKLSGSWEYAIAFSLLSHFVLDAIPHWHYPTSSDKNRSNLLGDFFSAIRNPSTLGRNPLFKDLLVAGFDFLIGALVLAWYSRNSSPQAAIMTFTGGFLGALPDLMTLLHWILPDSKFLSWFRELHKKIHARKRLDDLLFWGVTTQAAIIFILVLI